MLQDDYLMRMMNAFARSLAHVTGLLKKEQYEEAGVAIDQALRQQFGLSDTILRGLSADELLAKLRRESPGQPWQERSVMLSALLRSHGDLDLARHKVESSHAWYVKALHLLLAAAGGGGWLLASYAPDIDELVAAIETENLPPPMLAALFDYYEREGRYARAENILYTWLDADLDHAAVVTAGLSFYERLLRLDDEDLIVGHLPRDEVEAGLEMWRSQAPGPGNRPGHM